MEMYGNIRLKSGEFAVRGNLVKTHINGSVIIFCFGDGGLSVYFFARTLIMLFLATLVTISSISKMECIFVSSRKVERSPSIQQMQS